MSDARKAADLAAARARNGVPSDGLSDEQWEATMGEESLAPRERFDVYLATLREADLRAQLTAVTAERDALSERIARIHAESRARTPDR